MVLKSICLVRHGSRKKYGDAKISDKKAFDDPTESTGAQHRPDDPLTVIGVEQANELAKYLASSHPEISVVYTSRHYRCLETAKPYVEICETEGRPIKFRLEIGLSEWQRVDRKTARAPSPKQLKEYHPTFDTEYQSLCHPLGHENLDEFYARNAYFLARLVQSLDNDPAAPESVLLCTSASNVAWIARILLGKYPDDPVEQDFEVPAIAFYKFSRRDIIPVEIDPTDRTELGYPQVDWQNKTAVGGSWGMTHNADCSFLSSGSIMLWTPSDIPEYLPPLEAVRMPKPCLPNYFDLQELNFEKSVVMTERAGKKSIAPVIAVGVPA
ncbi:hypothetical protein TWF281_009655 [Arthrobotrys megalospora]